MSNTDTFQAICVMFLKKSKRIFSPVFLVASKPSMILELSPKQIIIFRGVP